MRRLFFFFCIILMTGFFSCRKSIISSPAPDQFPQWLQERITVVTQNQKFCSITSVTVIEYKGQQYYNIYCGFSSCMYCELYDLSGNHPVWDSDKWNDFAMNKKEIKVLKACL